jgi:hypothetical protein
MKLKHAIQILQIQKEKLNSTGMLYNQAWKVQTKSYIKRFFGDSSAEYKYIMEFSRNAYITDEQNLDNLKSFLEASIETIANSGLYKPPALNFLHTIPNEWVIGAFSLIVSAIGFAGYTIGKTEASVNQIKQDMRIKELEDSLGVRSPFGVSNKIPAYDTNKNQNKNPETH